MKKKIIAFIKKQLDIKDLDQALEKSEAKLKKEIKSLDRKIEDKYLKLDREDDRLNDKILKLQDLSVMGVDLGVHADSESYIILASKLKGGIVKIIPIRPERINYFMKMVSDIEQEYGVKRVIKDLPRGLRF